VARAAWQFVDKAGAGQVRVDDMEMLLHNLGARLTRRQVEHLVDSASSVKQGVMSGESTHVDACNMLHLCLAIRRPCLRLVALSARIAAVTYQAASSPRSNLRFYLPCLLRVAISFPFSRPFVPTHGTNHPMRLPGQAVGSTT
jgi:hypothetical protein